MRVTNRKTSWGRMVTGSVGGEVVAELMHFESPGSFHTHERTEYVICVAGSGTVVIEAADVTKGMTGINAHRVECEPGRNMHQFHALVPAGRKHRMEPGPDGMTCLIWYGGDDG